MISHGKDMKIFTGNANPALAQEICKLIGIKLGEAEVKSFADGEASVSLYETVRGSDVFLINSTCKPVNDSLMELLIMIDACKRASAGRVTAVIPYFGYARQDRKAKSRDPISAKLVANMLTASGADRVLTMDLHASQIQGFFDIPVDNLLGNPVFVDYYAKKFGEKCEDMVVVSPDVGSVARARTFAQKLHMGLAIVDKRRQKANQCEVMNVIGDVEGKDCILFDDMIDTAGSICNAAKAIVEVGGAKKVYAIDVGYGQLAWKLRTDERVVNMERTNIRNVTLDQLAEPIEFFSVDVSFISLHHIFPVAQAITTPDAMGVCLVKPQFEAGREKVGKNGVVRDPATHREVLHNAMGYAAANGFKVCGLDFSPVKGPEGNIEYLMFVQKSDEPGVLDDSVAEQVVASSHSTLDR